MTGAIDIATTWDATASIVATRLAGPVTVGDVAAWADGLAAAVAAIPAGRAWKLLADLHGFAPVDLAAHKAMREVVPRLLARHGMRPAVIDLFDDAPAVAVAVTDRKRCVRFANVHHDADKMVSYDARIGRADQRFFSDRDLAEAWLRGHEAW